MRIDGIVKLIVFILIFCTCCSRLVEQGPIEEFSKMHMGRDYEIINAGIFNEIDTILEIYPNYFGVNEETEIRVLPILCFNKNKDRFKTSLIQHSTKVSSIGFLCGFKYKGDWEFYRPSVGIHYFNEHFGYPDSVAIPMEEMEEYARGYLNGYLKKNKKSGEWEINDNFFKGDLFDGPGWGNSTGDELLEKYMNAVRARNKKMAERRAELKAQKLNEAEIIKVNK